MVPRSGSTAGSPFTEMLATRIGLFQKKKQRNDDDRVVLDLRLLVGPVQKQLSRLLMADDFALLAEQFDGGCHVVGRQRVHGARQIYFIEEAHPIVFGM